MIKTGKIVCSLCKSTDPETWDSCLHGQPRMTDGKVFCQPCYDKDCSRNRKLRVILRVAVASALSATPKYGTNSHTANTKAMAARSSDANAIRKISATITNRAIKRHGTRTEDQHACGENMLCLPSDGGDSVVYVSIRMPGLGLW